MRNITIKKIILSEQDRDEVVFDYTSIIKKQTEISVGKTNLIIDDQKLDFSKLNLNKKLSYFIKIMVKLQLQNCSGQVNNFTDKSDWKNIENILNDIKGGKIYINILKTYENILWMKINKLYSTPARAIIYHEQYKNLREEAFYDALLRYVEYKIYGQLISLNFKKTICLYQDPGFPMAGQHFKNSKLPVMFIDPDALKNRLKFDYSSFISYDNKHMENLKDISSSPLEPKKRRKQKKDITPLKRRNTGKIFGKEKVFIDLILNNRALFSV